MLHFLLTRRGLARWRRRRRRLEDRRRISLRLFAEAMKRATALHAFSFALLHHSCHPARALPILPLVLEAVAVSYCNLLALVAAIERSRSRRTAFLLMPVLAGLHKVQFVRSLLGVDGLQNVERSCSGRTRPFARPPKLPLGLVRAVR